MAGKQSGGINIRDRSVNSRGDIVGRDKVKIIPEPKEEVGDFTFKIARVTIFVFTLFVGGILFFWYGVLSGAIIGGMLSGAEISISGAAGIIGGQLIEGESRTLGAVLGAVIGGIIGLALAVGLAFMSATSFSRYKQRYAKSDIVVDRDEVKIIPAPTEEISDFSFKMERVTVFVSTLLISGIFLVFFGATDGGEIVGMLIGEEFRTLGAVIGGIIGLALAVGFTFMSVSHLSRYKHR